MPAWWFADARGIQTDGWAVQAGRKRTCTHALTSAPEREPLSTEASLLGGGKSSFLRPEVDVAGAGADLAMVAFELPAQPRRALAASC